MKVLTNERDRYKQMYDNVREEAKLDILKNVKTQNISLATQSLLKRIENERDSALNDLRNIANDRDIIKDRFKVNSFSYNFNFLLISELSYLPNII